MTLSLQNSVFAENLYVDRIGLNEGLSQNTIESIVQDHAGFIWIATRDGLNRYDGYKFTVFNHNENNPYSIGNKSISDLLVDDQGVLWVGHLKGLDRYEESSGRFYRHQHDPKDKNTISSNGVRELYMDSYGYLWVGTDLGLNRFNRKSKTFTQYLHDPENPNSVSNNGVNSFHEDHEGIFWVGTDHGLNRYDYQTQHFERIDNLSDKLNDAIILAIEEDIQGRLWLATANNGLFVLDKSRTSVKHYRHDPTRRGSLSSNKTTVLYYDSKQQLWVGTEGGGLNRYDEENDRFLRYRNNPADLHSLSDDIILGVFEDQTGVLWIGTYTNGISKLSPYGFSLTLASDKPSLDDPNPLTDIRPFVVDRHGALWVGSSYRGLKVTRADGNIENFYHDPEDPNSLSSNRIYTIYEDKKGVVWVGAIDGWLNRYNRNDNNFTRFHFQPKDADSIFHSKVRSILEDQYGLFWVSLDFGGLHLFNRETYQIKHFHHDPDDPASISNNRAFVIYEDRRGAVWLATYGGGINKLDRNTNTFKTYRYDPNKNSISNDFIMAIIDDHKEDVLWLGTDGAGFDRFDLNTQTFENIDEDDGLPNGTIYGILQDKQDHLWLSHNKGITRYNIKTEEFSNYEESEGLQSNEFNGGSYYKAPDGKFYFGGIHGYNTFYPEQIINNPHKPPVYITDFQLFNKSVEVNKAYDKRVILPKPISSINELLLSYKDTVFSFEFSALDYAYSAKNQYAYRMEGLETDWNYVDSKRRFATYTTLPPGDYTFRVKASNNNNVWNEEGVSLNIKISPPFWQTWWFRTLCLLIIISTVAGIFAARVKAIHQRNKILKEQVRQATSELQKEKNNLEKTLVELGETKDALIESAHKAGMADTATGVLHNVGNILNSVNTSAGLMREAIDSSVINRFVKGADLLVKHKDNLLDFINQDPKGLKLLDYFVELVQPSKKENELMKENLLRLHEKINAINETIAAQQSLAKSGGLTEELSLINLVEDSIALQSGSINRHEIKIERKYDETTPKLGLQKAKVVQIIITLYKKAKESMDTCQNRESILTIEIKQDENNAYLVLQDNGAGIEKHNLENIFAQHFSDKSESHAFSLHSCANYMSEMGGRLWAESDGLDQGTRFIMSFPLRKKNGL